MPRTIGPKFPIVLTSYEIAMVDAKKFLRHYTWKYLVVDEVPLAYIFLTCHTYTVLFYKFCALI